ncbi:MAG: hypothetical protein R2710_30340 [Acidimicrobiales bacterium]
MPIATPSLLLSGQPLDDAMAVTADPIAQLHLEPADEEFLAISCERRDAQRTDDDAATSRHIATAAVGRVRASNERPACRSGSATFISPTVEARSALISAAASALDRGSQRRPATPASPDLGSSMRHATP